MISLSRQLLRIFLAAVAGIAATAAMVRLATLNRRRAPGWTLLVAALATLAGVVLTVGLVWWDRQRRPAMYFWPCLPCSG
ncbi:hypothetical protein GCM10010840_12810 [Deinococcus aerolatus]|uniref:Uncharacterized protein n=1 Tax=Deinococcus aerolatus TaxID=522487 RepID=A0ABQ2G5W7_9DEIO|nr:hypothetical protein [Deinococcus aerolatus]GGL76153.1 hypothetical protein GCM10010840_12810 [Deinococcus aerolatus]